MTDIAKIAAALDNIKNHREALSQWMKSVDEQRNSWGYPTGIEVTVRDLLDVAGRLNSSVQGLMEQVIELGEALRTYLENSK